MGKCPQCGQTIPVGYEMHLCPTCVISMAAIPHPDPPLITFTPAPFTPSGEIAISENGHKTIGALVDGRVVVEGKPLTPFGVSSRPPVWEF